MSRCSFRDAGRDLEAPETLKASRSRPASWKLQRLTRSRLGQNFERFGLGDMRLVSVSAQEVLCTFLVVVVIAGSGEDGTLGFSGDSLASCLHMISVLSMPGCAGLP